METKLKKSTTFHPQTNGQTEVVNWKFIHLLIRYCNKHPKLWDEQFHYIQHAYNKAKHSSTNTSPFEACYGYLPRLPLDFIFEKDVIIDDHSDIDKARKFIEKIQLICHTMKEQLEKSQSNYKARHEKHRVDHKFQVGDEVWLYISKERLQGEGKNLKPIHYGKFWKRLVTMHLSLIFLLICKYTLLLMLRIWDYLSILWLMIKEIMFNCHK